MALLIGKWIGAALLVGSAQMLANRYRTKTAALLSLVQGWRAYLAQAQHAVQSGGVQFSELVRQALTPHTLSALLPQPPFFVQAQASAQEKMTQLCCAAAQRLPQDHPATAALRDFAQTAAAAISPQQLCQSMEALDERLAELEQATELTLRQKCRAAAVLSLCGALCVVLLLW